MIQANELRIGNYIAAKGGKSFQVQLYHINKLQNEKCKFYGTPITEEWLLKFGFNITGKSEKICHMWLDPIWITNNGEGWLYLANQRHVNLFYIHQLQNLYFSLTNKELEINE